MGQDFGKRGLWASRGRPYPSFGVYVCVYVYIAAIYIDEISVYVYNIAYTTKASFNLCARRT